MSSAEAWVTGVSLGIPLHAGFAAMWHAALGSGHTSPACCPPHKCPPTPSPAAAMFHYVLEGATIRPLAPPSELPDQQVSEGAECRCRKRRQRDCFFLPEETPEGLLERRM